MKGIREPLLWIALASFVAFLPFSTVALPVSAALALSMQCLSSTRLGSHARKALLIAAVAAWFTCALHATFLTPIPIPFHLHRLAGSSMTFALLAMAHALGRMAETAAIEESALWLLAVRVLFVGGLVIDLVTGGAGVGIMLLSCPIFAVLVLQLRARIPQPDAR